MRIVVNCIHYLISLMILNYVKLSILSSLNFSELHNKTFLSTTISQSFDKLLADLQLLNDTFSILINTSNFEILEELIQKCKKEKIDFSSILNFLVNQKINTLQGIYKALSNKDSSNLQVVSPAFLWSEDMYGVHLDILFSHRHNAPGCSEVDDNFTILYNNNYTFHFNANCTMGDDELYFNLDLNLYDQISKIERVKISRGKAEIRLEKVKKYSWGKLLREGEEIPNNMLHKY